MASEREDRPLQVGSYWDGEETGEMKMEKRKESEDHLTESQAVLAGGFSCRQCLQFGVENLSVPSFLLSLSLRYGSCFIRISIGTGLHNPAF